MTRIHADITVSLDGFVTGPDPRPGRGLGEGGERLHYWIFGGPWTYDSPSSGQEATRADAEAAADLVDAGAVIVGRGMFDDGEQWGGENPYPMPIFVLTSRITDDLPAGFTYLSDLDSALTQAAAVAGERPVLIGGGPTVIRQCLRAGVVDRLTLHIAPVVLGGGTPLFDGGFAADLTPVRCRHSALATHLTYDLGR
ncbi:dihydrofolate reductase family protein [Nonomuraea sp. NPDC050310]|uniref:dihydrofolate reductase family protein n=1 Tax=Nonomuraea sp. NPDC050310 TaxID=3154935 RepID=UPI0033C58A52